MTREDEYQRIARIMEGFASQIVDEAQRERCMAVVEAWRKVGELAHPPPPKERFRHEVS